MQTYEKIEEVGKIMTQYWEGSANKFVRYYIYINQGLAQTKAFQTLVLGILGLYAVLKLTNPWIMAVLALVSMPCLLLVGRFNLMRVSKVNELVNNFKASILGYKGWNMGVEQYEMQKEILKTLKEINKKLK